MRKNLLSLALAILTISTVVVRGTHADSKEEKQARFAAGVKQSVANIGTGRDTWVEVKLNDKSKLKGFVRETGEDIFVVVDPKTGAAADVSYAQVKQVKGHNLSTGARISLGIAVTFAVVLLVGYVLIRATD